MDYCLRHIFVNIFFIQLFIFVNSDPFQVADSDVDRYHRLMELSVLSFKIEKLELNLYKLIEEGSWMQLGGDLGKVKLYLEESRHSKDVTVKKDYYHKALAKLYALMASNPTENISLDETALEIWINEVLNRAMGDLILSPLPIDEGHFSPVIPKASDAPFIPMRSKVSFKMPAAPVPKDMPVKMPIKPIPTDVPVETPTEPVPSDASVNTPTQPKRSKISFKKPIEPIPNGPPAEMPIEHIPSDVPVKTPIEPIPSDVPARAPIKPIPNNIPATTKPIPNDIPVETPIGPIPSDVPVKTPIEPIPDDIPSTESKSIDSPQQRELSGAFFKDLMSHINDEISILQEEINQALIDATDEHRAALMDINARLTNAAANNSDIMTKRASVDEAYNMYFNYTKFLS